MKVRLPLAYRSAYILASVAFFISLGMILAAHVYGYRTVAYVEYWPERAILVDEGGKEIFDPEPGAEYRIKLIKRKRIETNVRIRLFNSSLFVGEYVEWYDTGSIRIRGKFSSRGERIGNFESFARDGTILEK